MLLRLLFKIEKIVKFKKRTRVLRRKAYKSFLKWKQNQKHHRKVLFVTGARQIGKSTLVRYLGETEYSSLIEINLLSDQEAKEALAHAQNTQDFLNRLITLSDGNFNEGDTLIFIDEIQELLM